MKIKRRAEKIMIQLILDIAQKDERIRAVIMNGSRASPSPKKDIFQDFDIVYIVTDVEPFVHNFQWLDQFGNRLIMQMPDEMDGKWPKHKNKFAYLIQFKDGNRIDLTLMHKDRVVSMHRDSHSILLLDKDNLIVPFGPPTDKDYLPSPPTETNFKNACNEFLWVSIYVAKGICRRELTYAKEAAEHTVKEELIKLLIWYVGMKTHFKKNIGKSGKYLEKYLEPRLWSRFKGTYVDADYNHMWEGLLAMCNIFNEVALKISQHYGYYYNEKEYKDVIDYLNEVKNCGINI